MSLTQAQLFEKWKAEGTGRTFKENWAMLCLRNVNLYRALGWHIIPIARHKKVPLRGEAWAEKEYRLDPEVAFSMACEGFNLAVVAGLSNLVLLDHDSELPENLRTLALETMTEKTPRGYCIFTQAPFDPKLWKAFTKHFTTFDNPRNSIMYSLVPPSRTCIRDFRGMDTCVRHEYRVREWIGAAIKPMPFNEFIERAMDVA